MLVNHNVLLQNISTYQGVIAVWGLSTTTKNILDKNPSLCNKIDFIIDTDSSLHKQIFNNIMIISLQECLEKENVLIVLWGNHIEAMILKLQSHHFENFLIDYEHSKNYIPKTVVVELDYLKQNTNINDFNYKFCNTVIEYCIENSIECHVKPYLWKWDQNEDPATILREHLLVNTEIPKDRILISYHSVGDSNPQILRWKEGYLHKSITFDENGYSGWSSLCKSTEAFFSHLPKKQLLEKHLKSLQKKHIYKNRSKYQQPKSDYPLPEQFIFFPLQVLNDTVMLHSYFDPMQLIESIVTILNKQKITLVIKRHPRCTSQELYNKLCIYEKEKKVILFEGSIHDAISKASTVYVINSGVGFEALMHLKPVVSFGKSDYMHVTKNVTDLKEIQKNPFYKLSAEEEQRIKLFLYNYTHYKSLDINNKIKIKETIHQFLLSYLNKVYYENHAI